MVETAAYQEVGHVGEVELRNYPAMVVATVSGHEENEAFGILFKYISGDNQTRKKIAMTAPVITSEKIEMTAPVISDEETMSFVMPSRYSMEDLPVPLDSRIRIQELSERKVAVIRFTGHADPKQVADVRARLLSSLEENGIRTVGRPFLMRYNAPITPGFIRRNEVGIVIRQRGV
jgi:effector-binding domain-containing protein